MKLNRYLWSFFILFIIGGCENLEETYSDYTGNGTIRYLGKCKDLSVSPGWQRLIVKWTNHVDPAIDKIKVSWTLDGVTRDSLLEKGTTECSIRNLKNGTYEVSVQNVDKAGNCSLPVLDYKRPYTLEHENVISFTRLFDKYFWMKDRLVLFFGEWQKNIETASLNYYSGGKLKEQKLDSVFITDNKYYLIPDKIDAETKVVINRSRRLAGCSDLIVFNPYELTRENKIYTPDFKQLLKEKYGQSEITETFINSITELEIDYDMDSFEDIMNLPNLKTLILGKNRYLNPEELNLYEDASQVSNLASSIFALNQVHEILDAKIQRYNKHYIPEGELSYIENLANPQIPDNLNYLNSANWTYSCSNNEHGEGIKALFDENSTEGWQPTRHQTALTYEITVDMQAPRTINGVQITQQVITSNYKKCIAQKIQIKTSMDQRNWQDATYVIENRLGNTSGETTIINFPIPQSARYLKFTVSDLAYNSFYYTVSLGKIKVF